MSASTIREPAVVLSGWELAATTSLWEREVHRLRALSARDGGVALASRVQGLFERLREGSSCAAQLAQLSRVAGEAESGPMDEWVTTEEAAEVMACTPANVRARCKRGSLVAFQPSGAGTPWLVSRRDVEANRSAA